MPGDGVRFTRIGLRPEPRIGFLLFRRVVASASVPRPSRSRQRRPLVFRLLVLDRLPRSGARLERLEARRLNYNIRMLGRRGVLVINVVAGMPQLADVEKATPALLAMVDFQPSHRYADFNADTDKTATYGLAALVAGGVAAKKRHSQGALAGHSRVQESHLLRADRPRRLGQETLGLDSRTRVRPSGRRRRHAAERLAARGLIPRGSFAARL